MSAHRRLNNKNGCGLALCLAKALNIVQKASGLTVTSPQRVEWGRLRDYGLRLITTPSIPGDIISKRSKNSKELDLVTDGFIMEKIRFEVIQRPNSQRGVSPLTISHDEEPPSISVFSSSALNESPLAASNLSFAVPTSNKPIPSTSTSSFISQPAPPTLAAAVAVPGVQRGRKRKARKAATDHRKRPGGVSLRPEVILTNVSIKKLKEWIRVSINANCKRGRDAFSLQIVKRD